MNQPWLTLNMLIFGTDFAVLGAAYASNSAWGPQYGAVILGLLGLFLGAVLGGWRGRMVQDVFGPLLPDATPRPRSRSRS
jgi:hypothetical protein